MIELPLSQHTVQIKPRFSSTNIENINYLFSPIFLIFYKLQRFKKFSMTVVRKHLHMPQISA